MLPIDKLSKVAKFLHIKGYVERTIKKPKRGSKHFEPRKFKNLNAAGFEIDGFPCVTADKGGKIAAHAVFLHGGAYVSEGLLLHRVFMEKLIKEHAFRVTYVDYPLAPEHGALKTHEVLEKAYAFLRGKYPDDRFVLLGDSAGGGLALAFLQRLATGAGPMPEKTVLLSPWLDVTMSRPEAAEYEKKDPTLSIEALVFAGREYAKELDGQNPLVSPIFGNMEGLGDILVTVGTHELFYPDCEYLKERVLGAAGSRLLLAVFKNMFHDFPMTPLKESDIAAEVVARFCTDKKQKEYEEVIFEK